MKLRLEGITKIFPSRSKNGKEVVAVNNFTYEIPDGKLVGLLGPSGCGKSTTLYMICGLQKPSSGKIFFGDDDVTELTPENRGVGLVFQNYALYPHMTVKQNIMFPLENLKGADRLKKDQMLDRAYEAARLVQIDELMDRKPSELSGGQQQRVAIARALVKMPRVLLLDEPLSNLDARLRLQTREEIKRIQRETNITTVFVTHDQDEAMSISDIIVVMKLGVVQQIGKPQDVYDDPANLFVAKFLGIPPINVLKGVVKNDKLFIDGKEVKDFKGVKDSYIKAEAAMKLKIADFISNVPEEQRAALEAAVSAEDYDTIEAGPYSVVANYMRQEKGLLDQIANGVFDVFVGIRPEGFNLNDNGNFELELDKIEVMGRDISLICKNEASINPFVRAIISSDFKVSEDAKTVKFDIKPHKLFVFNGVTEERIYE